MKTQHIELSKLKPHPDNPRVIKDKQFNILCESIAANPDLFEARPLLLSNRTGELVIIGGNQRFAAAKKLGLKTAPCALFEGLTIEREKELMVRDNVQNGDWNWSELGKWDVGGLESWGLEFPKTFFNDITAIEPQPDKVIEIDHNKPVITKAGDVYELGKHRVICGDCTNKQDAAKLFNRQKAAFLFTSPPYSNQRKYSGKDDLSVEKLAQFITVNAEYTDYQCVNLGIQRIDNDINTYWDVYIQVAKQAGLKLLSWNVWDKVNNGTISNQVAMFGIRHEFIFVFGITYKQLNRFIINNTPKKNKSIFVRRGKNDTPIYGGESKRHDYKQLDTIQSILNAGGDNLSKKYSKDHPALFPVELPKQYILSLSNIGEIVVDSFLGSGTTLIAADITERICYGYEIYPLFVDLIVRRYIEFRTANDKPIVIKRNGKQLTTEQIKSYLPIENESIK